MSGTVQASWMSRLPAVRERLGAGFAGLGLALLALGVGTVVAMVFAATACRRFGSRRVVSGAVVVACGTLAGLGTVRWTAQLVAALFCFGLAVGAWDVAMNIQGAALERETGRSWLSGLHGWWSMGSVAGAGLGVMAAKAGLSVTAHLGLIALVGTGVCLVGATGFIDDHKATPADGLCLGVRHRVRTLGMVALLILVGATIEGAAGDWLPVYLAVDRRQSHAGAAIGYAVFVGAVAGGRLLATRSYRAIGLTATVRWGAVLAAVGVLVVVLAPWAQFAVLGALCWGLGICVVFPAALSASGRGGSGSAVAAMTTVGYGAGVIGPLMIGPLAGACGLGTALLVLPVLTVILMVFAPHLDPDFDKPTSVS